MLFAELENLDGEADEDGDKDNKKNIVETKSGDKSGGKSNKKTNTLSGEKSDGKKNKESITFPSAQPSDSFANKDGEVNNSPGSINSAGDTIDELKAALENGKELTGEEIANAKETIMGFRNAAAILFKKAEDLEKLLAN